MNATRITLDSNILHYAFDTVEASRQRQALEILMAVKDIDCPLGLQAIGEFFVSVTKKAKLSRAGAQVEVGQFLAGFELFPSTANAHRTAAHESAAGRFGYWDAVLLASASEAGCTLCLSEDMGDGARLGNIVVRNPFGEHELTPAARAALGL
ncbi:MAG TPA: PIN domain-containing protein [Rhizomicrobium sp.]|jgi:predicted nucleic acid-binding protein|nr:PIN domain-containing protein [Rhizomicrobium sp.]